MKAWYSSLPLEDRPAALEEIVSGQRGAKADMNGSGHRSYRDGGLEIDAVNLKRQTKEVADRLFGFQADMAQDIAEQTARLEALERGAVSSEVRIAVLECVNKMQGFVIDVLGDRVKSMKGL